MAAGQHHGSGAHGAGFQRAVERHALQSPMPDYTSGLAQGDHLGVSSGVLVALAGIEAAPDDFPGADSHRTHRDITMFQGLAGFLQRQAHEVVITVEWEVNHGRHYNRPRERLRFGVWGIVFVPAQAFIKIL